jgi:glutamine amidotransferase
MKTPDVTIIDYGVGNILSVQRGFEHCGASVEVTSDPKHVTEANRLVLPGVGAFDRAMQAIEQRGLDVAIKDFLCRERPLLGICLGMQLLFDESEEFGRNLGLGIIAGGVVPIPTHTLNGGTQKIPHIGWNSIHNPEPHLRWNGTVLQDNQVGDAVYFVHSFMAIPQISSHVLAYCLYGGHEIVAVVKQNTVTGCQFHPEKSGEIGLKTLRRFTWE